jgi:hypothetical protein
MQLLLLFLWLFVNIVFLFYRFDRLLKVVGIWERFLIIFQLLYHLMKCVFHLNFNIDFSIENDLLAWILESKTGLSFLFAFRLLFEYWNVIRIIFNFFFLTHPLPRSLYLLDCRGFRNGHFAGCVGWLLFFLSFYPWLRIRTRIVLLGLPFFLHIDLQGFGFHFMVIHKVGSFRCGHGCCTVTQLVIVVRVRHTLLSSCNAVDINAAVINFIFHTIYDFQMFLFTAAAPEKSDYQDH